MSEPTSEIAVTLVGLHLYPVKSCAGIGLDEALLIETGLEFDRTWMLVDAGGRFVTQRELPRLALIAPTLRHSELVLRAPGMLALHFPLDAVEQARRVHIWRDEMDAYDMGDLAAQWCSDFLGAPLRLVRFDPEQRRLSSPRWTGGLEAENAFSDGYPLLVVSNASLDELNHRLDARGEPPITMERFRPNLVLDGLAAHEEDHVDELAFETEDGPVRLKLVKPCARCAIPNIDPLSAEIGLEPGRTLGEYRADPRLDGAVSFGMNAVIVEGIERRLSTGLPGRASLRFD